MKKSPGNARKTRRNRGRLLAAAGALLLALSAAAVLAPLRGPSLAAERSACESGAVITTPGLTTWSYPCGWVAAAWWSWLSAGLAGLLALVLGRGRR